MSTIHNTTSANHHHYHLHKKYHDGKNNENILIETFYNNKTSSKLQQQNLLFTKSSKTYNNNLYINNQHQQQQHHKQKHLQLTTTIDSDNNFIHNCILNNQQANKIFDSNSSSFISTSSSLSSSPNHTPPTPPPVPPLTLFSNSKSSFKIKKMNDQTANLQTKTSNIDLNNCDDDLAVFTQKPKIIKYNLNNSSINNTSNSNSSNTLATYPMIQQKRLLMPASAHNVTNQKLLKDEVIRNNAKNSYYLSETILYNIDNIVPKEKLNEKLIISKQGTVRGNLNQVKLSLKQFLKENHSLTHTANTNHTAVNSNICNKEQNDSAKYFLDRDYEVEEQGKIVIYTTTLQVVRESNAKCKRVKKILQSYCVRYEERDLYKKKEYQRELKYRLNLNIIDIPYIFFNGKLIGNCDQLEALSDQGYLNKLFKDLEKIKLKIYCSKCGGYRFVLCTLCNGSKKIYNNFTILKCTTCNEDGLLRCDSCLDQQE